MELQELGNLLNHSAYTSNPNIGKISLVGKNRPGVFGNIKKRMKWILIIFMCVTLLFMPHFMSRQKSDLISLFLYIILSIESIISIVALTHIRAIEHLTGNITQNLLRRIQHLKLIFRSYIFLNSFLYILLLIFLEYAMYHHPDPNFEGFCKVPLPFRLTIYTFFIISQYYMKRRSFQKNYGEYLSKMISILEQTRE